MVVSNTAGSVTSSVATLVVTAAPVAPSITSQPANQTTFAGQTATFSVIASGTVPLSYQWQKNGAAISGATSSSYTTPPEITSDNGAQFTVVISNTAGTIISNAATLTVNPDPVAPSITAQPASQTIAAGQTATFSVTATGTAPLSYQWQTERNRDQRSNIVELHHSGGNGFRQRRPVQRCCQQLGRHCHQQCRHSYGECSPCSDRSARQPNRCCRSDRYVLRHCDRNRASELSMAEKRTPIFPAQQHPPTRPRRLRPRTMAPSSAS